MEHALIYLLFCVSKWGWGWDRYMAEANAGDGWKIPQWVRPWFQFGLPALIVILLVQGLL